MAIDPPRLDDILRAYLQGSLTLAESTEQIAAMLDPQERFTFTIEIPLHAAATTDAKQLMALRRAVNANGAPPGTSSPA